MLKLKKANTAVQIILGILFLLVGALFLAAPVVSLIGSVWIAGIALAVLGVVHLALCCRADIGKIQQGGRMLGILLAALEIVIGFFIIADKWLVVGLLPLLVEIWLVVMGVVRIMQSIKLKKARKYMWYTPLVVAIFFIVIAVLMLLIGWLSSYDIMGTFIGAVFIIYGIVMCCGAIVKPDDQDDDEQAELAEYEREYEKASGEKNYNEDYTRRKISENNER